MRCRAPSLSCNWNETETLSSWLYVDSGRTCWILTRLILPEQVHQHAFSFSCGVTETGEEEGASAYYLLVWIYRSFHIKLRISVWIKRFIRFCIHIMDARSLQPEGVCIPTLIIYLWNVHF